MSQRNVPVSKGLSRAGAGLLGVAGAIIWACSQMVWLEAEYADELSGGGSAALRGAQWSTEITAVAIVLLAGMVAGFALRRVGRQVVGAVSAAAAGAAAIPAARLALSGADPERVHAILTAGAEEAQSAEGAIAQWAEITAVSVRTLGPALTLLGCLAGVVGGLLLLLKPGTDSPRQNKYEKDAVRMEKVRSDLEEDPSSGRVLWDAISADIDPTDPAGDFRSGKITS